MCTITNDDIRIEIAEYESRQTPTHTGEYFARFMSLAEYDKLMKGVKLVNERNHSSHARTSSKGFCFIQVDPDDAEDDISYAYQFLSGIVSNDIAVIFRNESANLVDSYGQYADPYGGWYDTICVDEFCTDEYDMYSMVPVQTILPNDRGMFKF